MIINVNTDKDNFIYDCKIFPRKGEFIVYKNNYYMVTNIYYRVTLITTIDVDAEFRFKD